MASPRDDGRRLRELPENASYKAFVGNLPDDCAPGEIDDLFKNLNIRNVKMVRDHETDRFRGFAYIEFGSKDDLEIALKVNGSLFGGQTLRVDIADAERGRSAPRRFGSGRGYRGYGHSDASGSGRGRSEYNFTDRESSSSGLYRGGRGDFDRPRGMSRGRPRGLYQNNDISNLVMPSNDPNRPRLNLTPRTTDPVELERIRKKDEEDTKRRQAHIFGLNQ